MVSIKEAAEGFAENALSSVAVFFAPDCAPGAV